MFQVTKDLLVPLIAPAVAIIVPTILFFVIPRRRDRQRAALDLFNAYWALDMRQARLEVWAYFVTQVSTNPEEQIKRFDRFLALLLDDQAGSTPETMDMFLKAARVLDFFALVEGCLHQGLVNEELIRVFLANYYLWWRERVLVPLWQRQLEGTLPRHPPLWWRPLIHLDRVTGFVPTGGSSSARAP